MKKLLVFVLFIALSTLAMAQQGYQDVVYLKNGSIVKGIIVENTPNVEIKIKTPDDCLFVFAYSDILKFAKEQKYVQKSTPHKYPGLSFLFSFLVPGIGQDYNGQPGKGLIMTTLYVGSYAGILYGEDEDVVLISAGVLLADWVWSMIDAPICANKINRRNSQGGYSLQLSKGKYLNLSPDILISQQPNMLGTTKTTPTVGLKLSLSL